MANGYGAAILWKFRKEIRQPLVQGKLLSVGQNHNGHRGELFSDRGEAEVCVGAARDFFFQIRQAIALGEYDFPVLDDGDAGTGRTELVKIAKKRVCFFR